jgi:hypothetical protein
VVCGFVELGIQLYLQKHLVKTYVIVPNAIELYLSVDGSNRR